MLVSSRNRSLTSTNASQKPIAGTETVALARPSGESSAISPKREFMPLRNSGDSNRGRTWVSNRTVGSRDPQLGGALVPNQLLDRRWPQRAQVHVDPPCGDEVHGLGGLALAHDDVTTHKDGARERERETTG